MFLLILVAGLAYPLANLANPVAGDGSSLPLGAGLLALAAVATVVTWTVTSTRQRRPSHPVA
jgi:hypothetical protein